MIGKHHLLAFILISTPACAKDVELKLALDSLLEIPGSFSMDQDQFEKLFAPPKEWKDGNPYFDWLTKNRDRAVFMKHPFTNVRIDFSLFEGEVACDEVMKALSKLDYCFKTRFSILACSFTDGKMYSAKVRSDGDVDPGSEFDSRDFRKTVARFIDDGIPLLWSLQLGRYPEEPPISKQASGGHMRMIIGYDPVAEKVIFTDSWGAGHERKMMTMEDAFAATTALYVITPTIN